MRECREEGDGSVNAIEMGGDAVAIYKISEF